MLIKLYLDGYKNDEIYTEERYCEKCGKNTTFKMKKQGGRVTFYGLPLFSFGTSYIMECDCGHSIEIKKKEYRNKLARKLLELKKSMSFTEYEESACKQKFSVILGYIMKVLISGWIARAFAYGTIERILKADFGTKTLIYLVPMAFVIALFIPFVLSVDGLHITLRKHFLYKKIKKKEKQEQPPNE